MEDNRRSHRERQQISEPIPPSPMRGDQSEESPLASAKFVEHLLNQHERRERMSLETVSTLKDLRMEKNR